MPLFDFKCPECGSEKLDVLAARSAEPPRCFCHYMTDWSHMGVVMVRQQSSGAFRVEGYSAQTGYTTRNHTGDLKGIRTKVNG